MWVHHLVEGRSETKNIKERALIAGSLLLNPQLGKSVPLQEGVRNGETGLDFYSSFSPKFFENFHTFWKHYSFLESHRLLREVIKELPASGESLDQQLSLLPCGEGHSSGTRTSRSWSGWWKFKDRDWGAVLRGEQVDISATPGGQCRSIGGGWETNSLLNIESAS